MSWLFPIPPAPWRVTLPIGLVFIVAWIVLWGLAIPRFRQAKTTLSTRKPAQALITWGIYKVSRNPLYLGWTCLYLGVTVLANAWWAILTLVPVLLVVDRGIVHAEERVLERRFGDHYLEYKRRVRRWL